MGIGSAPQAGDSVYVEFQNGDAQYPVYDGGRPADGIDSATGHPSGNADFGGAPHGLFGVHRGTVVDNVDPMNCGRVLVLVPSAGTESLWATPVEAPGQADVERRLPSVGDDVEVEFENGDPERPVYVGGHVL